MILAGHETVDSTALRLPRLGMGGAPIGNLDTAVDDAQADGALAAAWSAGIRYFDTSPWYGLGLSEHRMGRFLRSKTRDEYVLSTKVGRLLSPSENLEPAADRIGPWATPLPFTVRFDYSYDGIIRSYEDSIQRLGIPRIDILFIHDLDRGYHGSEEVFDRHLDALLSSGYAALRDLRADRKIRAIGAGVNTPGVIPEMLATFDLDMFLVAGPYTLIDHSILDSEMRRCVLEGVSVIIGSALYHGLLARGSGNQQTPAGHKYPSDVIARIERIRLLCNEFGIPLGAVALQFPAAHPAVVAELFGAVNAHQAEQAARWFSTPIPVEFWGRLRSEGLIPWNAPTPNVAKRDSPDHDA